MEEGQKSNLRLEIAHVLFLDIVGYSKLLIDVDRAWILSSRKRKANRR
jgi:hypothetical protein